MCTPKTSLDRCQGRWFFAHSCCISSGCSPQSACYGKTKQDPQVHWRELSRPARPASRARGLESYLALVSSSLLSSCSWENFSKRAETASPIGFFQQETWWLGQVRLPPLFAGSTSLVFPAHNIPGILTGLLNRVTAILGTCTRRSNGSPTQQAFTSACVMHLSFFKVFEEGCIST